MSQYKERDYIVERTAWHGIKGGKLHYQMALAEDIFRCHMGQQDGRDPGSLQRLMDTLGWTRVDLKHAKFNPQHWFLMATGEAFVLTAALEEVGYRVGDREKIKTQDYLNTWLKEQLGHGEALIVVITDFYAPLRKVKHLREEAKLKGDLSYAALRPKLKEMHADSRSNYHHFLLTKK